MAGNWHTDKPESIKLYNFIIHMKHQQDTIPRTTQDDDGNIPRNQWVGMADRCFIQSPGCVIATGEPYRPLLGKRRRPATGAVIDLNGGDPCCGVNGRSRVSSLWQSTPQTAARLQGWNVSGKQSPKTCSSAPKPSGDGAIRDFAHPSYGQRARKSLSAASMKVASAGLWSGLLTAAAHFETCRERRQPAQIGALETGSSSDFNAMPTANVVPISSGSRPRPAGQDGGSFEERRGLVSR